MIFAQPLTKVRSLPVLALPTVAAALLAAPVAGQRPPCADALRSGQPGPWETAELIAADVTLDGVVDAVYWRVIGSQVVLLIGTCDGGQVAQRWHLAVDLPAACSPAEARVEAASLLVDDVLVERTCAGERSASECAHLRRTNVQRQALMDAGGRALRIGGPSCTAATLRWSFDRGGFLQFPG